MKSSLLALFFLFTSGAWAQPAVEADIDSVSLAYAPCLDHVGSQRIHIRNLGDSTSVSATLSQGTRGWVIRAATWMPRFPLASDSTIWFDLEHERNTAWTGHLRDTLIVADDHDTLRIPLAARSLSGDLVAGQYDYHFAQVPFGDTARGVITLHNRGEADIIIDYLDAGAWSFADLKLGDRIPAHGSRSAELVLTNTALVGEHQTSALIAGRCGQTSLTVRVRVYDPRGYWTIPELVDTITGCARSSVYSLRIRNDSPQPTRIDSIRVEPLQAQHWRVSLPTQTSFVEPGSERSVFLERDPLAGNAALTLYAEGQPLAVLPLRVAALNASPRIRNSRDTLSVDLAEMEPVNLGIQLVNQAAGPYRLTSITIEGAPEWSVGTVDTSRTIGKAGYMDISFPFSGAPAGIYIATAYIQGTPCDTVLKQVLVARVGQASVADGSTPANINVAYAPQGITLNFDRPFTYYLFDVRGSLALSGSSSATAASIDLRSLPRGAYILRIEAGDFLTSRKVVW